MSGDDIVIAEVEGVHTQDGSGGRQFYAWCRLSDGRLAIWNFDLAAPPGQAQTLRVVESR